MCYITHKLKISGYITYFIIKKMCYLKNQKMKQFQNRKNIRIF